MRTEDEMTSATLLGEPLAVELMNTVGLDRDGVHDALDSDAGVAAWLCAVGARIATEAGITLGELDNDTVSPVSGRLRALRDALRRLAAETTNDPRPPVTAPHLTRPDAISTLNTLARTWPELVWPENGHPSKSYHNGATTLELAVGLIAHHGVELFTGQQRARLRPCLAPNCPLFFIKEYGRRQWCSAPCGNRARVTRHYQRHHTTNPKPQ